MVSQFGSLDYTIMGKTADLTVVQKTIIDTLHKEGKTQTFIAKEAVHRVLYPSMLTESWVEGKSVEEKDGVGPLCFLKTNVTAPVYQDIMDHFMLPSADQLFKDADFIFQQDLAPVHTAKSTKSWLNDHVVGAWLASKLTRPEHRESVEYCQEENEKQETKTCRWAEGHSQRNLGFIPPQQCHKLITSMPRRIEAVIKAKGAPTKYWVHVQ